MPLNTRNRRNNENCISVPVPVCSITYSALMLCAILFVLEANRQTLINILAFLYSFFNFHFAASLL